MGKTLLLSGPRNQGVTQGYTVVVLLTGIEGKTSVRVTSFGTQFKYQNRYFLVFRKAPINTQVRCESTGVLEPIILSEIIAGL